VVLIWGSLLYAWSPRPAHTASGLTLHFLDVGQGDGAVLRTPAGRWVVIDAGPRSRHSDAGRRVVVPFLIRSRVRELAALIVSMPTPIIWVVYPVSSSDSRQRLCSSPENA
jgi:beta-lactamase superfamily II metal-dependent hydrolase